MSGPLYIPDKEEVPVLAPPQGALASPVSGGLRGFLRKAAKPLFYGFASGVTGDPMYGMKVEAARQQAQAPSLQDTLTQLRIRDYENRLNDSKEKKEAEKAKQEKLAKLSEFIRVGDIESARAIATELEPKSAIGELFRAQSAPTQREVDLPNGMIQREEWVDGKWSPVGAPAPRWNPNPSTVVNNQPATLPSLLSVKQDYDKGAKRFRLSAEQLPMMRELERQGNSGNSASDLGLIVAVAKIRDPESVVREGEVEFVREDASKVEEIKLALKRINSGQVLLPEQRRRLVQSIEAEMRSLAPEEIERRKQFDAIAGYGNFDPSLIYGKRTVEEILNGAVPKPRTISAEEARELGLVK